MEKTKIIIDCDPGHDDAIAILMASRHPAIDLLALTTVAIVIGEYHGKNKNHHRL